MDYLLGVDGGGTKTMIAVASLDGEIIIERSIGSINFKSIGVEGALKNFIFGINSVIKELESNDSKPYFKSSCFGLAGLNTSYDKVVFVEIVLNDSITSYLNLQKAVLCNDTVIGLAAGSMNKNRVIIICGTGSNCFGINEEGNEAKANGWDYILGDEGSGTSMGIKTLRAILQSYDGRGDETLLTGKIFEFLNINSIDELNRWTYDDPFSKDRFASLSFPLCITAEMGDKVAIRILKEEAEEVIKNVSAVVKRLNLEEREFDLVFVGNNFKCMKYFQKIITKKLKDSFPKINFIPLTRKPVIGAIRIALKNL
ncbi:MAG TPA: BadF/BadG/BcrA/BcrD ATPase family protein [Candidatus Humimicrobiaceae bacterium]